MTAKLQASYSVPEVARMMGLSQAGPPSPSGPRGRATQGKGVRA